jgi:hypothetical protein
MALQLLSTVPACGVTRGLLFAPQQRRRSAAAASAFCQQTMCPPAGVLQNVLCAGMSALTTLSRLTRLVLEGDGFGIAELAMKVGSLEGSFLLARPCHPHVDEPAACPSLW